MGATASKAAAPAAPSPADQAEGPISSVFTLMDRATRWAESAGRACSARGPGARILEVMTLPAPEPSPHGVEHRTPARTPWAQHPGPVTAEGARCPAQLDPLHHRYPLPGAGPNRERYHQAVWGIGGYRCSDRRPGCPVHARARAGPQGPGPRQCAHVEARQPLRGRPRERHPPPA